MLAFILIACAKPPGLPAARMVTGEAGLSAEWVAEGTVEQRMAVPDGADLVLYYLGEQKGDLAPCGCPDHPRGGLPRAAAYIAAADGGLVLNGGYWLDDGATLDGSPMADAVLKNNWMVQGLKQLNVGAVHVGFDDLIGLSRMSSGPPELPMVSANLQGPGIVSHQVLKSGALKVGITGVSHPGSVSISTPGYTRGEPEIARGIIEKLASETDIVVLFNHGATKTTKALLGSGAIDVVIDTAHHRSFDPPFRHGGAIWVRSHDQGQRLGELRIGLENGDIAWAIDRKIDMDVTMPDEPSQASLAAEAQQALKALDTKLFGR